nr:type ISP restriction/modification enzyme [Microcella indica]
MRRRWDRLRAAIRTPEGPTLFKETRDRTLSKRVAPLESPGASPDDGPLLESMESPAIVRVGYRTFDRQWLVGDARILDMPRPTLWEARASKNVFSVEQHSDAIKDGPGIVFSALIPDLHHFNNRGGRTLPMLHPDGSPNLAPGLLDGLASEASIQADHHDLLAYVAGVVAQPAFTETFVDELTTPGVRVPITRNATLWQKAVEIGREVIWLHTYAERYVDPASGREDGNVRSGWPMDAQPKSLEAVTTMPVKLRYDDARGQVVFTDDDGARNGAWGPVPREVFDYTVGGMNVIGSWFKYRKKNPGGKKTSPLDDIHIDEWPHEWTLEFTELLTVLTRLVSLEPAQAELLEQILGGELITKDELAAAGVRWPESRNDRKPRRKVSADALDIFGDDGS